MLNKHNGTPKHQQTISQIHHLKISKKFKKCSNGKIQTIKLHLRNLPRIDNVKFCDVNDGKPSKFHSNWSPND